MKQFTDTISVNQHSVYTVCLPSKLLLINPLNLLLNSRLWLIIIPAQHALNFFMSFQIKGCTRSLRQIQPLLVFVCRHINTWIILLNWQFAAWQLYSTHVGCLNQDIVHLFFFLSLKWRQFSPQNCIHVCVNMLSYISFAPLGSSHMSCEHIGSVNRTPIQILF